MQDELLQSLGAYFDLMTHNGAAVFIASGDYGVHRLDGKATRFRLRRVALAAVGL